MTFIPTQRRLTQSNLIIRTVPRHGFRYMVCLHSNRALEHNNSHSLFRCLLWDTEELVRLLQLPRRNRGKEKQFTWGRSVVLSWSWHPIFQGLLFVWRLELVSNVSVCASCTTSAVGVHTWRLSACQVVIGYHNATLLLILRWTCRNHYV